MTAFLAGLGLGLLVAAQVGPISLLCLRTVVRQGFAPGLAVGLGAAVVDTTYGALGMLGAGQVLRIAPVRIGLGLVGAAVLVWVGARTFWRAYRVRVGLETAGEVASVAAALRTSLLATASNPLTIVSWATLFAAASTARVVTGVSSAVALLVGIGLGSAGWFTALAGTAAALRRGLGPRTVRLIDVVAGAGLVGFGGALGFRTLRDG